MQIAVERVGNVAVAVVPVEELDASNAGEFKRDIAPLLDANARVVLDLTGVRFVDSSGLGAFISCLRKLNAKGGDLKRVYRPTLCQSDKFRSLVVRWRDLLFHLECGV